MKEKLLRSNVKYHKKVELLLDKLEAMPEERLHQKTLGGGWSAMQTAWHLLLVEENSLSYVQKKLGFGGVFEKNGLKTYLRSLLLLGAFYLPLKFKAPASAGDANLPIRPSTGELRRRWVDLRVAWTGFLEQLPGELLDKAVYKHPRVGKIGWMQMMLFLNIHFDRHLRQIKGALGK